jgi:hypothetical protein
MKVLSGELKVHPGSYPGSGSGQPDLLKPRGKLSAFRRACNPVGRNECEFRAGLESEVAGADLPEIQGRPPGDGEATFECTHRRPPG